ncbi:hypothetical protein AA103196_2547 [Ameyamaea chiangmaiensis NBRC 103196]|uniref:Uncharacterized protein n=1 Tax=Ameyamaea chiangmaiensis TaxID=442969 RepID=A0A850PBL5_9PROT|nr:hypothetical protein [Ameyamaea chiangmaiensis]MBS4075651.1 hypothetical protein [Ameyamaea chiangmaiensis]NVN41474.1 hypothetical protein [Ameyamaea chiangmaiensis]GBQ70643.1 hypothetical protein AA103196_2547 [Ameyamaea chiangmaiensis NBRC 103196]
MSMQPAPTAITPCPLCGTPLRSTAESCSRCGAVRQFGPTRAESIRGALVGAVAAPAITAILQPSVIVLVCVAIAGLVGGFYVAHARHGADRWLPPSR